MDGRHFTWTLIAGEDLNNLTPGKGHLFRAIALDDGRVAENGLEAGGILLYGGREGEHISIGYLGIIKFLAGEEIKKGELLTVGEDGSFIPAKEGDWVVGRCLDQGGYPFQIVTGAFNFTAPHRMEK